MLVNSRLLRTAISASSTRGSCARPRCPAQGKRSPGSGSRLRTLIARYIQDGEPVGSQTLARVAGLEVSPATIRNILGDLEDLGLLASPHTSAGRVPTAHGYRVFVDSLLQMQPPGEGELARLRQELAGGGSTQALLGSASELLSAMSHFVGVVSAPRREQFAFRQIDFVALDGRRVLAILVFADNEVQNRVIETRQEFAPGQLEQVANYLNAHFAGLPMAPPAPAYRRPRRRRCNRCTACCAVHGRPARTAARHQWSGVDLPFHQSPRRRPDW